MICLHGNAHKCLLSVDICQRVVLHYIIILLIKMFSLFLLQLCDMEKKTLHHLIDETRLMSFG